jgi:hypothetical protein
MSAATNRPARPQMLQTTRLKRSRHEGFGGSCGFSSAGGSFRFTNGLQILPEPHSLTED